MLNIWQKLKRPILILAPMAGYTDSAFRLLCKKFGADLLYTEMISAAGIVYNQPQEKYDFEKKKWVMGNKSWDLAKFESKEQPVIVQLFGSQPKIMGQSANLIYKKLKPSGIDLNIGCPASKIVKQNQGVRLMQKPELVLRIIKEIKNNCPLPLSIKTRLGFNDKKEILKLAPLYEKAGIDALCIHARIYRQFFKGPADFDIVAQVKKMIKIPVIANGGIDSDDQAKKVLEITHCDGIAVAQGALGRPWLFQEIKQITKNTFSQKTHGEIKQKSLSEIKKIILKHASLFLKYNKNLIPLRKHLIFYFKGQKNASKLRREIVKVESLDDLKNIVVKLQI